MALDVKISDRDLATKYVALRGRLDAMTSPSLDEQLAPLLAAGPSILVLDLARLTYINSAGLRVISTARKAMEARNGLLLLVNVVPQIQRVFAVVKALPSHSVFKSNSELDHFIDHRLRTVRLERRTRHAGARK
jgi:anti-sigma B factor antagonist